MCCVSGGGYIGASFVQHLYELMVIKKLSYEGLIEFLLMFIIKILLEAVQSYFSSRQLYENSSFLINCRNPYESLLSCAILFCNNFFYY